MKPEFRRRQRSLLGGEERGLVGIFRQREEFSSDARESVLVQRSCVHAGVIAHESRDAERVRLGKTCGPC